MRSCVMLSFVVALAVAVPPASAQSLAEVAAREKERREKLKKQESEKEGNADKAKSFSEDDLDRARRSGARIGDGTVAETAGSSAGDAAPAAEVAAAAGGEETPAEKTEDDMRAEAESDWRKRFDEAEADRAKVAEEISTVERALADNTVNMFGTARQARLDRLEQAKALRVDIESRIQALQQEGRQNRFRR